jgi:hypothetical protein
VTWCQTYSGKALSFLVPDPDAITIDDIAIGLARECRFGRQTRRFYSVAQHSVFVAKIVHDIDPGNISARLWALLHDAHEAYTGDLTTPLMDACDTLLPHYVGNPIRTIQLHLNNAICDALGVEINKFDRDLVRHADLVALSTEIRALLRHHLDWGIDLPAPLDIEIIELDMAAAQFLWRSTFDVTFKLYQEICQPKVAAE